jgi:hypothetical protein
MHAPIVRIPPEGDRLVRLVSSRPVRSPGTRVRGQGAALHAVWLTLFLSACANAPTTADVSNLEPACARSCLASHSQCISRSPGSTGWWPNEVLRACRTTADSCLSTCPAK